MRFIERRQLVSILGGIAVTSALAAAPAVRATEWHAVIGAQSTDKGHQALAFLPNEIWIHSGDSITWTFAADEIHTLTFLTSGQMRPGPFGGCPGFATNPATFDGSTCVSTPPLTTGATFTVNFPTTGNFKFVCLVHNNMTGAVHVLDPSQELPHTQGFYDMAAMDEGTELLSDSDPALAFDPVGGNHVTAGVGEISSTAGGQQTLSVLRFVEEIKVIHSGETAEWTNNDPVTPHTITFGKPPAGNPAVPSSNVMKDADGAEHATIKSTSDNVHSGFIVAALQEQTGQPQQPLSVTRFRVTFMTPGTYRYMCVLHGGLGMMGKVVVLP